MNLKSEPVIDNTIKVNEYKEKILKWSNPVEFVNNLYGSHPDTDGDYFINIYGNENES